MRSMALCLLLMLVGCSATPDDPSASTKEQDRELNDAAAQLDLNTPTPAESPAS